MTDERIIAYLLKELPEEELEQFEDECFAPETWPSRLDQVEEDLVDAYLSNELTQERRKRFERNYLTTPTRRDRVTGAAILRYVACTAAEAKTGIAKESTWFTRFHAFWNSQTLALRTAVALLALAAIAAGALWLNALRVRSPGTYATLTLSISTSNNRAEGAQARKVNLEPGTDELRVFLTLPERSTQATTSRVTLENDSGETKLVKIIGQDAQAVSVAIPAAELSRGRYALNLFAIKDDNTEQRVGPYFFTVE